MMFLERLAERKIEQAVARGEFADLPGNGQPIPEEVGMDLIAPELRMTYRLLKNAGYLPEEVLLLREIDYVSTLIRLAADAEAAAPIRGRLRLLLERLSFARGEQIVLQESYWRRVAEQLGAHKVDP